MVAEFDREDAGVGSAADQRHFAFEISDARFPDNQEFFCGNAVSEVFASVDLATALIK